MLMMGWIWSGRNSSMVGLDWVQKFWVGLDFKMDPVEPWLTRYSVCLHFCIKNYILAISCINLCLMTKILWLWWWQCAIAVDIL